MSSQARNETSRARLEPPKPVVCAERFELGSLTFVVFELGPPISLPPGLTKAESEIARALFQGKSAPEIARERLVSYRTVANQLASIYRKLRVNSAVELMAVLQRRALGESADSSAPTGFHESACDPAPRGVLL